MQEKNNQNPFELFLEWFSTARQIVPEPTAMSLATVDATGKPSVRIVLMKEFDERGLVFYTNLQSRKSRELRANPMAAVCFLWVEIQKQVRIEGEVALVEDAEADAYFATRPRASQLGAWASQQSDVLESRDALLARFQEYERKFDGQPVPRPPFWSGFRLHPQRFEFWQGHANRLNDRLLFVQSKGAWEQSLLYP